MASKVLVYLISTHYYKDSRQIQCFQRFMIEWVAVMRGGPYANQATAFSRLQKFTAAFREAKNVEPGGHGLPLAPRELADDDLKIQSRE
jgi:hypothetical protein